MYYIILVINIYLHLLCDSKTIPSDPSKELIVRGNRADEGQFPFAVAIQIDGEFICTGSLISDTRILTAAHCVIINGELQSPDSFCTTANLNRTASKCQKEIIEVTVHPEYSQEKGDKDIAILRMESPFSEEDVSPVHLAGPKFRVDKNAVVIGWGRTENSILPPEILQYAPQKIVKNSICSIVNAGINRDKICARGPFRSGVCNGDSGGPLISMGKGYPVQIGVTSYGNNLGCGNSPAVFTKVSSYVSFIKSAAKDDSIRFV